MEEHEAAISRFVTGEDSLEEFFNKLRGLGFSRQESLEQISLAEDEKAELAQVASDVNFSRMQELEP